MIRIKERLREAMAMLENAREIEEEEQELMRRMREGEGLKVEPLKRGSGGDKKRDLERDIRSSGNTHVRDLR